MRTEQLIWSEAEGWTGLPGAPVDTTDLVLVFAGTDVLEDGGPLRQLRKTYPRAHFLGCSTAGEICDTRVSDHSLVATVVHFDRTSLQFAQATLKRREESAEAGRQLSEALNRPGLRHILVFSDGLHVNGSALVRGLAACLPSDVTVTGGLAGDGERFGRTYVLGDQEPLTDAVVGVGFYGESIRVGHGSLGGWDPFGPERMVTRSDGNVLYELDGQSALALYKRYLGEHAAGLPAAALLFPLAVQIPGSEGELVRTILGIDEPSQSMTFAGDVPEGARARMMKANFDRLIDGASGAARAAFDPLRDGRPALAILISCVGRRLVLKQRTEEEIESVRDILGHQAATDRLLFIRRDFPPMPAARCELHNQTMTITTFMELSNELSRLGRGIHFRG